MPVPPPSSANDVATLFEDETFSDLTFVVQGEDNTREFKAHRAVLMARSSVFRAMLDSSGMAETRANTLTLAQVRLLSFSPLREHVDFFLRSDV